MQVLRTTLPLPLVQHSNNKTATVCREAPCMLARTGNKYRYSKHRRSTDDMHVLMLDQGASDDAEAANYPISCKLA